MAGINQFHGNMYFEVARFRGMVSRAQNYTECFHTKDPVATIWTVGQEYAMSDGSTGSYGAMANYNIPGPTGVNIMVDHTCAGPPSN